MNEEIKQAWVEALESGDYEQGRGVLESPGGMFCCLGVLCDLAVKAGVAKRNVSVDHNGFHNTRSFVYYGPADDRIEEDSQSKYDLPVSVQRWAGLRSSNPGVKVQGLGYQLSDLNDGSGGSNPVPFTGIAALIREQL